MGWILNLTNICTWLVLVTSLGEANKFQSIFYLVKSSKCIHIKGHEKAASWGTAPKDMYKGSANCVALQAQELMRGQEFSGVWLQKEACSSRHTPMPLLQGTDVWKIPHSHRQHSLCPVTNQDLYFYHQHLNETGQEARFSLSRSFCFRFGFHLGFVHFKQTQWTHCFLANRTFEENFT